MSNCYDTMQVCKSGHQITANLESSPENGQEFCDKCGAKTITNCENCGEKIRGYHHIDGFVDFRGTKTPNHCHHCGSPYPWGKKIKEEILKLSEIKLHKEIELKCKKLFDDGHYSESVEKAFKTVKDKLRNLTGFEKASDAFGAGKLYVQGASQPNVDADFQQANKFLMMAIDQYRNEKVHTADGKIEDPNLAIHYLSLASLAMLLLDRSVIE